MEKFAGRQIPEILRGWLAFSQGQPSRDVSVEISLFLQRGLKEELKKGRGVVGSQGRKAKKLLDLNGEFFLKV